MKSKVLKAFDKCKVLYMEMDLQEHVDPVPADTEENPRKISDDLNSAEKAELEQILLNEYSISLEEADHQPAIFLVNRMLTSVVDCDEVVVYEMELLKKAIECKKPVFGLETLSEQMGIAAGIYTSKELLNQLKAKDVYEQMFASMTKAYQKEDLNSLLALVTDPKLMTAETEHIMVAERNHKWADQLDKVLGKEPAFIAVGAGHLPGKKGLIELLREKGYRVNPVYR